MARAERSDAHLPLEEAKRVEEEARRYFDELLPKRHHKPARSDPSGDDAPAGELLHPGPDSIPPELEKLRELSAEQQKLVCVGGGAVDEYVETEYYTGLHLIDKQHHTTGSGFIKLEKTNGSYLNLKPDSGNGSAASCKGNPATNDWIPAADTVIPASRKPNRSDS